MPNLTAIQKEILKHKNHSQDTVRRKHLAKLSELTKRDTIIYASCYASSANDKGLPTAIIQDDIQGFMAAISGLKGDELDLILHSPGGSLEAAEQIVNYLRSKYNHIRAIIPQNAMSAATMIACAADEIIMGKQSAIGPIDPQITLPSHNFFTAPAQALLDDFEEAKKEVTADPQLAALWVSRMKDYPPGIFNICKNTIEVSKEKVKSWLTQYMFSGEEKAAEKADDIAEWLGDAHSHKTHGHPIGYEEALNHGLKVVRLEDDQDFQDEVLTVFHATVVTFQLTNCAKIVENHEGHGWYLQVSKKSK